MDTRPIHTFAALILLTPTLAGCAATSDATGAPSASLTGTATYRERMALPPNAVFEATLEDSSRADVPSEVLGRARIESPGQPPIQFSITYDAKRIEPNHRYVVRARITLDGGLMFTTDTAYPVLGPNDTQPIELLLRRAGSTPPAPSASGAASSTTPLEGTYWKLTGLGIQPIEPAANRSEPHLTLDPSQSRVTGSGGCNRFMGSYRLDGDDLSFGGVAGTLMACMEGQELERAFLSSLEHVTTYRIAGKRLDLLNANGETVAQFEASSTP